MNEYVADFDRHANAAIENLVNLLNSNRETVIAAARARLIRGFDAYPDGPMFTWDTARLMDETLEELADATVYQARKQARLLERVQPSECRGEAEGRKAPEVSNAMSRPTSPYFHRDSFFGEW